ncbi:AMP-dependent synthetase/ligase [Nostocoides sp.]|uniref:AMP-dependent synthetase/ligase n=1 Tax=Nostocoides sp. TaxID=1917966 RepID=UPI003BAE9FFD
MLNSPTEEDVNHAVLENQAQSLGHLFRDRVNKTPDAIAYWYPEGEGYAKVTWRQAADRVYALAAGLVALGVGEEDRVAIAAGTSYDWVLADLANMCSGAATTTIYPTTIADDVAFIISDSGSKVIFAENAEQLEKLRSIRDVIPEVSKVVLFEGDGDGDWVMSMEDLEILGRQQLERDPETVSVRIENITPDRLATIIYTSGTTGRPKGVRLLHRAWAYEGAAVDSIRILGPDDLQYLWLPLAHVFGKVLLTLPIQIGFPTAIDGRIDKIVDNLAIVKPTFMGAAPRIFEKAYGRIQMMMEKEGGAKLKLFNWAGNVGRQVSVLKEEGKSPNAVLALQHRLADKIIMTKIRDRFGGNIRFFISGSAALNRDVARWFDAMGLQISEGYGMTESSAATTVNRVVAYKYGSVGWPLPGTELVLASDGEILMRGPGVMQGYHNNPEATAETLDSDGWLHTGDIGEIDERGFIRLTDRKKDLFKTSNGKYVAPSQIESMFKGLCPYASQIVVYGNDRNFVSALVTLDPEAIVGWAAANGLEGSSYEELASSEQAKAMIQGYIEQLNAGLNRWEQIKKFTILGSDLSIENGELTPSLKVKRKVVTERYKKELDAHYA